MPRIIIDSHHPKHYLTLRQLGKRCRDAGIEVIWTGRKKDVLIDLMREDGIEPHVLTTARRGLAGKLLELTLYDWRLARLAFREKPLALIGKTISIAHVGRLLGIPSLLINDDSASSNPQFRLLAYPFAHRIITPDTLIEDYGRRHRKVHGYFHLAYLHPDVFTESPDIKSRLGVARGNRVFVLRLAAFEAYHDVGATGLTHDFIHSLIAVLERSGQVFICAEEALPRELERYRLPTSAGDLHKVLAVADIVVGDGLSVCVEAALLGTPAITVGSYVATHAPYELWHQLQDRYGLMFCYTPDQRDRVFEKLEELLVMPDVEREWQTRRRAFLEEWTDPTEVFWEELHDSVLSRKARLATS